MDVISFQAQFGRRQVFFLDTRMYRNVESLWQARARSIRDPRLKVAIVSDKIHIVVGYLKVVGRMVFAICFGSLNNCQS